MHNLLDWTTPSLSGNTVGSGHQDVASLKNSGFIFSLCSKATKKLRLSQTQDKKLVKPEACIFP